ncbi:hypothetical protein SEPCBS119000_004283 [Sporothrix epigloea]|uniref:Uncharacterized protein n=1 Tax=Sporothrix epigloea TaxID=1892477 RepID=A0ABP0DVB9_9PEZI
MTESRSTIYVDPGPPVPADTFREDRLAQALPLQRKLEIHLERKSLKESGDYLGVQGINPETGQLDVLTPTTGSKSTLSSGTSAVPSGSYQSSMERYEKDKERLRRQQSLIRWRRETGQWSSVAEPGLSPIEQSRDTTPTHPLTPPGTWASQAATAVWHSVRMSSPGWGSTSAASTTMPLSPPVPPPVPPKSMHGAHSRPGDVKTDNQSGHHSGSAALRKQETFLPQPSLSSPDPRSDMHWGLASTKLADDRDDKSGDFLQASARHEHAASEPPAEIRKGAAKRETSRAASTGPSLLEWTGRVSGKLASEKRKRRRPLLCSRAAGRHSKNKFKGGGSRDRHSTRSSGTGDGDEERSYFERLSSSATGQVSRGQQARVCMHTHHHHYWIRYPSTPKESDDRQEVYVHENGPGRESSSRADDETSVQAAGPQHKTLFDGFPPECETEQMVERDRPPSRDSHARYFIVEAPRSN